MLCGIFLFFKQQEKKTSTFICFDFCLSNSKASDPVKSIKTLHTFKQERTNVYSLYRGMVLTKLMEREREREVMSARQKQKEKNHLDNILILK